MLRRFLSLCAVCVILFCVSAPAFATGVTGTGGVGIPVVAELQVDVVDFFDHVNSMGRLYANMAWNKLIDEDVCSHAPTLGGGHKFVAVRTMKDGQVGLFYQCEYCGRSYGDMLEEAYADYVDELPATQVNNSGGFWWKPTWKDFVSQQVDIKYAGSSSGTLYPNVLSNIDNTNGWSSKCVPGSYVMITQSKDGRYYYCTWRGIVAPYDARYQLVSGSLNRALDTYAIAGQTFQMGDSVGKSGIGSLVIPWPEFVVTPIGGLAELSADTRVASVSASGDGMYGYIGGDGTLYQSTVGDIYNETTNVYANPVTGDTSSVSSWTYDYSDRSYVLTTTEGDTVMVTYGDENVTINQGGTTYNVYYLAEEPEEVLAEPVHIHSYSSAVTTSPTCTGTGIRTYTCADCGNSYTEVIPAIGHSFGVPVVTTPATCTGTGVQTATCSVCGETTQSVIPATGHSYVSEVTIAPDCVNTGVKTYVCSACGDSYTQTIPATGHRWQVVATVPTVYDTASGELITEGYTLYECANCGEQYRIMAESDGSSLPSPASDSVTTGSTDLVEIDTSVGRGFLATIAHGLTEDLPLAVQAASAWFETLPSLYSGYVSFLKTAIAWLPDDIQALLRFGFGFPVFVGIVRKIWGR